MVFCPHMLPAAFHGPESMGTVDHRLQSPKWWTKQTFSLNETMISGMRYRNRKLTDIGMEKRRNHRMPGSMGRRYFITWRRRLSWSLSDDFDSILSAFLPILVCKPFLKSIRCLWNPCVRTASHKQRFGIFTVIHHYSGVQRKYLIWSCFCLLPTG